MEKKRILKLQFHQVLENGIVNRLRNMVRQLDSSYGTNYSEQLVVVYQWPSKFETKLFNARKVLESTEHSVDRILQYQHQGENCPSPICAKFSDAPQLHTQGTGTCLNTNDAGVLDLLSVQNGRELNQLYGEVGVTVTQWNAAIKEIRRRVREHLKHRPVMAPSQEWLGGVLQTCKEWVLAATAAEREVCEKLGLDSPRCHHSINNVNIAKKLHKFEKDAKEIFNSKQRKLVSYNSSEPIVGKVLSSLQRWIAFIKHDKEAGMVQIQCVHATRLMAAKAIAKQKRFKSLGSVESCERNLKKKAKSFYSGQGVGRDSRGSLVQRLCRVYGIDESLVEATIFANQMTVTYKAHKSPPEFRIVIGCVDREEHPNFYRKVHRIVTEGLALVKTEYESMARRGGVGGKKRSLNIVGSIQHLAKRIRLTPHNGSSFETADCEKCFPNTSVAVRTVPQEGDVELVGPVRAALQGGRSSLRGWQPTILDMFNMGMCSMDGPLYVKVNSSLAMLKKLLLDVFQHAEERAGGGEARMKATKAKRRGQPQWAFVVERAPGEEEQEGAVELSAEQFIRLVVRSLDNQVVCFGKEVLKLMDGSIEGQQSSMIFQNLYFQAVVNEEADCLEEEGKVGEAEQVRGGIDLYADDAASLNGAIGPRKHTMMRGQFNLEYHEHDSYITYVGLEISKCQMCDSGVETRPDMAKHGGKLFSEKMLDDWRTDNAPSASKMNMITGSIIRVYACSSQPYPVLQAVFELLQQALRRRFPMNKVCEAVEKVVKKLLAEQPRPEGENKNLLRMVFEEYMTKEVSKILKAFKYSRGRKQAVVKAENRVAILRRRRQCAACFARGVPVTIFTCDN
jgi:hypothetical protein